MEKILQQPIDSEIAGPAPHNNPSSTEALRSLKLKSINQSSALSDPRWKKRSSRYCTTDTISCSSNNRHTKTPIRLQTV